MEDIKTVVEGLQKVSGYFKSMLKVGYDGDSDIYTQHREAVKKAIELLKEQPRICVFVDADGQWHPLNMGYVKPVKPIRGGSGDGSKVWYLCGKCSSCVDDKDGNRDNFCSFCGSPVDWESADT